MLVNESERLTDSMCADVESYTDSLLRSYYPTAFSHIRAVERSFVVKAINIFRDDGLGSDET